MIQQRWHSVGTDVVARYLATGEAAGVVNSQACLDRIRKCLADETLWVEPPDDLIETVVERIGNPTLVPFVAPGRRRPQPLVVGGIAAAAALVASVLLTTGGRGGPSDRTAEVDLTGTELAPAASATATVHDTPTGVAITLEVAGLPPAPTGSYYQAWVNGPDGSVAIGTFHMRGRDDGAIELWSGVDSRQYPELTVTIEPEDGDPASSRRRVLTGTLG